jgi:hypothetical protein
MTTRIAIFFIVVFFRTWVYSAERITLNSGFGSVRITKQAAYFADTLGTLSIEQILNKPQEAWCQVSEKGFAKPFDAKPYWIKIPVRCTKSGVFFLRST